MRRYLVSVCQLVAAGYCAGFEANSANPLTKLDFKAPDFIYLPDSSSQDLPQASESEVGSFLSNIMMVNEGIVGGSSLTKHLDSHKYKYSYCSANSFIINMLMNEHASKFLQDLRLYICATTDISSSAPENVSVKNSSISNLLAIIYSWWYEKTASAIYFSGTDLGNEVISKNTSEQIKQMLDLLFTTYPTLIKETFIEETRNGYEEKATKFLETLHGRAPQAYIKIKDFHPVDVYNIRSWYAKNENNCEIFRASLLKYRTLYGQIFGSKSRFIAGKLPEFFFNHYIPLFNDLLIEIEQELACIQNHFGSNCHNVTCVFINSYKNWFLVFRNLPNRRSLYYEKYAETFNKIKGAFSTLFFNCIRQSQSDISAKLKNIIWIPRLLPNSLYLLETIKMIQARDHISKLITNYITAVLTKTHPQYYDPFISEYNCLFPEFLKSIWDLKSNENVSSVDDIVRDFTTKKCEIHDLENLYYAVKAANLSTEQVSRHTQVLLQKLLKMCFAKPRRRTVNYQHEIKKTMIMYAIQMLGCSVSLFAGKCSDSILAFRKCLLYSSNFDNYFADIQAGDCPMHLKMFKNFSDVPVVN